MGALPFHEGVANFIITPKYLKCFGFHISIIFYLKNMYLYSDYYFFKNTMPLLRLYSAGPKYVPSLRSLLLLHLSL